jgi:hypothetical protein
LDCVSIMQQAENINQGWLCYPCGVVNVIDSVRHVQRGVVSPNASLSVSLGQILWCDRGCRQTIKWSQRTYTRCISVANCFNLGGTHVVECRPFRRCISIQNTGHYAEFRTTRENRQGRGLLIGMRRDQVVERSRPISWTLWTERTYSFDTNELWFQNILSIYCCPKDKKSVEGDVTKRFSEPSDGHTGGQVSKRIYWSKKYMTGSPEWHNKL